MKKPSKAMQLRWVKILEEAKKELPRQGFVCWAIKSTYLCDFRTFNSSDHGKLLCYIRRSLNGWVTVQSWLLNNGINVYELGTDSPEMQAYRLAWINQMQDMFSKGEG